MVPEQCLFLLRLVDYCFLCILSFICFVPMCIVLSKHWGYCLLYADSMEYGPVAPCGYTIAVPFIFSLVFAGYMVSSYVCKLSFYNREGYIEETALEFIVTVMMDGVSWIMMFVNASLISMGFNTMCFSIFGTIERCSEGELIHPIFGTDDIFFYHLKMAEVAAWLAWVLWLAQFLTGIVALVRSGMFASIAGPNLCGSLPCRPQCTCSCKLHIQRHQAPASQTSAAVPPVPGVKV